MNKKIIYFKNYNKEAILEELLNKIVEKTIQPEDIYEISAILESFGWNDERAADIFGVEDIFELSQLLWDMLMEKMLFQPFVEEKKESMASKIMTIARSFLKGTMFAMPMAISVLAMLTLRFSLWSYENLSVELATSIAIGTILSFITVGGFTQAIARRGFLYINQGLYNIAKRTTYYLVKIGYICCIVVSIFYIIFNSFFKNFTVTMFMVTVIYYFFLCANWLSVTVMYILEKEITFTGLLTIGIIMVFILFKIIGLNILIAQIISLFIVAILGLIVVVHYFNDAEKKMEKGINPPMIRKSILIYSLKPYFEYGFLYFVLLFIDRIMAWSANSAYMPYIIWFRGEYELGLDFALLMLIFPMGVGEVVVTRFMKNLDTLQKNSWRKEMNVLNKRYMDAYIKSTISVFISAVFSSIIVFIIVTLIGKFGFRIQSIDFINNPTTVFVFICALISYSILSVGLTNAIILFSISVPEMVTTAARISVVSNFIIGFILSRWVNYSFAVLGLLVGSIVFCIISTKYVLKVMKNLDYYIYAAT